MRDALRANVAACKSRADIARHFNTSPWMFMQIFIELLLRRPGTATSWGMKGRCLLGTASCGAVLTMQGKTQADGCEVTLSGNFIF